MDQFVDLAWAMFTGTAWLFVIFWLTPYVIARRRNHRNKTLILALAVIFSLWPLLWVSATAWVMLLIYASLTEPEYIYVPGPPGEKGDPGPSGKDGRRGKDADEIPLSKAGVLKPPKNR